ncbi:hypothetical protein FHT21_003360 [Pedobacter sp. SG908]|nr:hypothetical protein [Pedobacter sp. SG908]NMN38826.1 hypothetical protein [Pedobacter sp. SG918]
MNYLTQISIKKTLLKYLVGFTVSRKESRIRLGSFEVLKA